MTGDSLKTSVQKFGMKRFSRRTQMLRKFATVVAILLVLVIWALVLCLFFNPDLAAVIKMGDLDAVRLFGLVAAIIFTPASFWLLKVEFNRPAKEDQSS